MATQVYISTAKPCDLHDVTDDGSPCMAAYDLPIPGRGWANVCEATYLALGSPQLGTGRGQRLIVGEEPPRDRMAEARAAIEAGDWDAFEEACGDEDPILFL